VAAAEDGRARPPPPFPPTCELDLRHRRLPRRRQADAETDDALLRERRGEDAVAPEALRQARRGAEDAAKADVLAEDDRPASAGRRRQRQEEAEAGGVRGG